MHERLLKKWKWVKVNTTFMQKLTSHLLLQKLYFSLWTGRRVLSSDHFNFHPAGPAATSVLRIAINGPFPSLLSCSWGGWIYKAMEESWQTVHISKLLLTLIRFQKINIIKLFFFYIHNCIYRYTANFRYLWLQNRSKLSMWPDQQRIFNNISMIHLSSTNYASFVSLQRQWLWNLY